ncbi:MAG: aconitate hydratase AcnA [Kiritimatiellaeota bacterium]|nr:aconitate hydratase AcnA [Kiritimatiellota bacterium]
MGNNSLGARARLDTGHGQVDFFRLQVLEERGLTSLERLPFSIRVLLESVLRNENGREATIAHIERLAAYDPEAPGEIEVPFLPARVLLQDFTGVPAVVDLAAMRSTVARLGGDPTRINPRVPVDLVIDHSVQVDVFGRADAARINLEREFERNRERYEFLRWGQEAFDNFRVIPPASGICHQINLEYLARVVQLREIDGAVTAFPDSLVGADSHTPMINGLGVVGWGVGGIEAEAMMLGQPIAMAAPPVVGVRITGRLPDGATATDAVLTITNVLRNHGVVGKFVEYFGPGVAELPVPDRAILANMAPEYGATMGFFPVDEQTLRYLRMTGRPEELVELVERYCREQGLFRTVATADPLYESVVEFDLAGVTPCIAGPNRPQDRVPLAQLKQTWAETLQRPPARRGFGLDVARKSGRATIAFESGEQVELTHGSVVIASITSCTNTSNPAVMLAAGLLARKAVEAGLRTKPWVKTSLGPGSLAVTDYLDRAGLSPYLDRLGFHAAGFGCMTCIGNSGPLPDSVRNAIEETGLVAAAALSGNRNFEGRVSPHVRAAYLASPPLVVAFALTGTVDIDFESEPVGRAVGGRPVFLRDLWPGSEEIQAAMAGAVRGEDFRNAYADIEKRNPLWNAIPVGGAALYEWRADSTYIQEPPFFAEFARDLPPAPRIRRARVLALLGDSITTDHISPAGPIPMDSPAGRYLRANGVAPEAFNSYGSRRGNDRVMSRGTFANIRLRNRLAPGTEGGWTTHFPSGDVVSIHQAAERYRAAGEQVIVIGGCDYGMGSSRDWAAKGPYLLGVRAVIAQSFERIHRSNLVGMGILPLQFREGENAQTLGLSGRETFDIPLDDPPVPGQDVRVTAHRSDGRRAEFVVQLRLDTPVEVEYYRNGGILQTVLRRFLRETDG